jgi:FecR protein
MSQWKPLPKVLPSFALVCAIAIPCMAGSQARVVRLSDVQGNVQIDRNTGQGYEKAFLNLPLTQGVKLHTEEGGQAALEFEDGSTVRLAPKTIIDLPQLSLRDSGAKVSAVHLQEGATYINYFGAKDDVLELTFGREKLTLTQPAHLRIAMGDVDAAVAVFKGEVQITGPKGTVEVTKNHTASFDLVDNHYYLADQIDEYPYDSWDKQQAKYQQQYSNNSYSSYSPYAYGTDDLSYYGSFFSLPGYGMLWQPYFTGAGWDPYMNGAWAFCPGFGYGWVSAYPWGWTPYHYGSWMYFPMYGWAWQPGGAWMGYNTYPVFLNPPLGFVGPLPPMLAGLRVIPVNRGPVGVHNGNKVQIANNSAGLGIPRGSVKNLGQLSQLVEQRGTVTAKVHTASMGSGWWHSGTAPVAHAGSAMGHGFSSMGHGMSSGVGGGHSSGGGHR